MHRADDGCDLLLTLTLTPGLGPTLIQRCIESLGCARAVLDATPGQLAVVRGIGPKRAEAIRRAMDAVLDSAVVAQEKQIMDQHGVSVCGIHDTAYPRLLRHIPDPPALLFVRGQLRDDDALSLAVVGTRRCTAYGREQADRFSALCAQAGLCIVSGGARGVDAAAHRATLRVGGRTIAVLGSGLARPYPPEHDRLFDQIVAGSGQGPGAVISELPMATPPLPENFPRRNRIVAGLSLGVLVIEAPVGSGAMITARLAADEQGREVMAVPGRVDSRASIGCHKMIREGWATLVTGPGDVLDALGDAGQLLKVGNDQPQPALEPAVSTGGLSQTQQCLLKSLERPQTLDQLTASTGLPVSTLLADMTTLEVRGLVTRNQGLCRQQRG